MAGETLEQLIDLLKRGDITARRKAATRLGKMGNQTAVTPLCEALRDRSSHVRANAIKALGRLGARYTVEPLCGMLQDRSSEVRQQAAKALRRFPDDRAIAPLCTALQDNHPIVRREVAETIYQLGGKAVASLCQSTRNLPPQDRNAARNSLAFFLKGRDIRTVDFMVLTASNLTPAEKWATLEVLCSTIGGQFFMPPYLKDPRRFCEYVRSTFNNALVQQMAVAVLEYQTLVRPGQVTDATARQELLRAAQGQPSSTESDQLLRASDTEEAAEVSFIRETWLVRLKRRLFPTK